MVQKGEPWIFWIVIPIIGAILIAGLPVVLLVHILMKLCGFKDGFFYQF